MSKKHDWKLIEKDVLDGILNFKEIAEKHGVDRSYLHKQAKKQNWTPQKSTKSTVVELLENAFISAFARDQYYLAKEKMSTNLTIIDDFSLKNWANLCGTIHKLEMIVLEEGETIISPKTGSPYQNPNYNALISAKKTYQTLGKELGLTPTSRKRAGVTMEAEKKKKTIFDLIDDPTGFGKTEKVRVSFKNTDNQHFEMMLEDFDCTQTIEHGKTVLEFSGDPLSDREQQKYNVLDNGLGFDFQECFYKG